MDNETYEGHFNPGRWIWQQHTLNLPETVRDSTDSITDGNKVLLYEKESFYVHNNKYCCKLTSYEIVEEFNQFRIYIDMHGNYMLGDIQDPKFCKLYNKSTFLCHEVFGHNYDISDPKSGYKGYVAFNLSQMRSGNHFFEYGESGYSRTFIGELRFEGEVKNIRFISTDGLVSKFNNSYYCLVEGYEVIGEEDAFRVYFDVHGDNSLGALQDPIESQLKLTGRNRGVFLTPINSFYEISDPESRYKGFLIYRLSDIIEGQYQFSYGSSGYTFINLFHA